jgi:hypothetical protein
MMVPKALARSTVLEAIKDGNASLALEYLRNTEPEEFATKSHLEQETRHVIDFDEEFKQRVKQYHDGQITDIPQVESGFGALPELGGEEGVHPAVPREEAHAADIR